MSFSVISTLLLVGSGSHASTACQTPSVASSLPERIASTNDR
jgi:hypothetical protein